ncbi:Coiled-coil and C2 domain-containing protein 2A [Clydaea vesicula]|uniref:Coiled-coil and C2 domain-containing protein 2A n=1 Tax=Clydaea vesicula TaxID=447962 RepID=A0AAD5U2W3_9FUNG|nr:Coiled-coil and C2 domain-containing protein 2A [Clydaea vesicula]
MLRVQFEKGMISSYIGLKKWENCESESSYKNVHFKEEEGFYLSTNNTDLLQRNLTKLNLRLRKTEGQFFPDWFNHDQSIALTPVPWKQIIERPIYSSIFKEYISKNASANVFTNIHSQEDENSSSILQYQQNYLDATEYYLENISDESLIELQLTKADLSSKYKPIVKENKKSSFTLILKLFDIDIKDHPLMTEEIRIAKELKDMNDVLKEREKSGIVKFLDRKLKALKLAYKEFLIQNQTPIAKAAESNFNDTDKIYPAKPTNVSFYNRNRTHSEFNDEYEKLKNISDQKRTYLEDIRATRLLRDTELQTDRILEYQILKKWDQIKHERVSQGFVSSSLKLMIQTTATVYEEDKRKFESEIAEELSELRDLHQINQVRKELQHKIDVVNWKMARLMRKRVKPQKEEELKCTDDEVEETDANERNVEEQLSTKKKSKNLKKKNGNLEFDLRSSNDKIVPQKETAEEEEGNIAEEEVVKDRKSIKERLRKVSGNSQVFHRRLSRQKISNENDDIEKEEIIKKSKSLTNLDLTSFQNTFMRKKPELIIEEFEEEKLLRERLLASVRPPGRPNLKLILSETESITETVHCPRNEVFRRRQLDSTSLSIKIFYNDKIVVKTSNKILNPQSFKLEVTDINDFGIESNFKCSNYTAKEGNKFKGEELKFAIFSLTIFELPETIKAEIYEVGVLGEQLVGEVFIGIPTQNDLVNSVDREIKSLQFTGRPFDANAKGIGKTENIGELSNLNSLKYEERWVSGILRIDLCWDVDEFGNSFGPSLNQKYSLHIFTNVVFAREKKLDTSLEIMDPLKKFGCPGIISLKKLMDWILEIRLDPNDQRNQSLLRLKQLVSQTQAGEIPYELNNAFSSSEKIDLEAFRVPFHLYWKSKKFFRLSLPNEIINRTMKVFNKFKQDEDITNLRNELIIDRWERKIKALKHIPLFDFEIDQKMYEKNSDPFEDSEDLTKFLETSTTTKNGFPSTMNLSETQSANSRLRVAPPTLRFIKQIRAHQLLKKARLSRTRRVEDYVKEEQLTAAEPEISIFSSLFSIRRPLKPTRTIKTSRISEVQQSDFNKNSCKIMIQVLRAFNVPVRSINSKFNGKQVVRSYVEATFQRNRTRTTVCEGPNPCWNETLHLNVAQPVYNNIPRNQSEFSISDVIDGELSYDSVYFNLFDEIIIDVDEDDREKGKRINQRIERNWLGTFSLPFLTIHEQIRVDGVFNSKFFLSVTKNSFFSVQMPPVTLGYEKVPASESLENAVLLGIDSTTNNTLIHIFITLEPALPQPGKLKIRFETNEDECLLRFANQWLNRLKRSYPFINDRIILTTCSDLQGKLTFITRYIHPQNPPQGIFGSSVERIIRFVSRIPYLPSRVMFSGDGILWSTTEQLLEIKAGDSVEHSILLCNLLLGLNKTNVAEKSSEISKNSDVEFREAYVILGRGIPEGKTAYVMLKEVVKVMNSEIVTTPSPTLAESILKSNKSMVIENASHSSKTSLTLINPVTGISYTSGDPYIPLKEVGCVFNKSNIWVNIQTAANPNNFNWDLSNSKCWVPLVQKEKNSKNLKTNTNKVSFDTLSTVQVDTLVYKNYSDEYVEKLELLIEKCLISKIEDWREHKITRWNRTCSRAFKVLITKFEEAIQTGVDLSTNPQFIKDLTGLRSLYHVQGFPLNLVYTDINDIIESVYNTDVYSNSDPLVEFSLAVSCKKYPGKFISVWIYVANLTR